MYIELLHMKAYTNQVVVYARNNMNFTWISTDYHQSWTLFQNSRAFYKEKTQVCVHIKKYDLYLRIPWNHITGNIPKQKNKDDDEL